MTALLSGRRPRVGRRPGLIALLLIGLLVTAGTAAASAYESKIVFLAVGIAGLVLLVLLPRRFANPLALLVIVGLALAVAAPGAPETGWFTTVGIAALLTIVASVRGTTAPNRHWAPLVLIALFYALLGVATLFGTPENTGRWVFVVVVPLLVGLLATRMTAEGVRYVALGVVLLAVGESMLGAAEVTVLKQPIWGYPLDDSGNPVVQFNSLLRDVVPRAQGSVGHPVVYGFVLAIGLVLAWVDIARIRPLLRWPIIAVIAGGLVLSGTRTAVFSAAVGVLLVLFSGRDVGRKVRAFFVVAFVAAVGAVLAANVSETADQVATTGSYTHRLGAIDAVSNLLGRPVLESLFGSGLGSERSLFARGLLQNDGFYAIDDELVTVLATAGVIALAAFVLACVASFVLATPRMRGVLVTVFLMFFSFDVTSWNLGGVLLVLVLTLSARRLESNGGSHPHPRPALERVPELAHA